jgi:hypothetical protein
MQTTKKKHQKTLCVLCGFMCNSLSQLGKMRIAGSCKTTSIKFYRLWLDMLTTNGLILN